MGGNADRTAGGPHGLTPKIRFAGWTTRDARLALFAFFALLIASVFVPVVAGESEVSTQGFADNVAGKPAEKRERDEDLALYDRAIERIQHGENYYDFIVAEHRLADYPVRPGVAVRLPTLAYIDAWLGIPGQLAASFALLAAVLLAWWGGGLGRRRDVAGCIASLSRCSCSTPRLASTGISSCCTSCGRGCCWRSPSACTGPAAGFCRSWLPRSLSRSANMPCPLSC
jgi:hypothetical protein